VPETRPTPEESDERFERHPDSLLRPSEPDEIRPGAIAFENGNHTTTVRTIKNAGTVQTASLSDSAIAPERFDYPLTLPPGGTIEKLGKGLLFHSGLGDGRSGTLGKRWLGGSTPGDGVGSLDSALQREARRRWRAERSA